MSDALKVPERMCVACRKIKSREGLFRFVKQVNSTVITRNDFGSLPGKGLYVCRDEKCWNRLLSQRNLKRTIAQRIDQPSLKWVESSLSGKE